MEILRSFPDLLRAYRRRMGWTQEVLAQRWHYSHAAISGWERGIRAPSVQEVPRLAQLLEVDPAVVAAALEVLPSVRSNESDGEGVENATGMVTRTREVSHHLDVAGELLGIYRDRTAFAAELSYSRMLDGAHTVVAAGISLNAIALQYSPDRIIEAITRRGALFCLCFLDPDSTHCAEREREEGLAPGTLAHLTRANLRHLLMVRRRLEDLDAELAAAPRSDVLNDMHFTAGGSGREWAGFAACLQLLTYDLAPRFNAYVIDRAIMTIQWYDYGRGQDTPILLLQRNGTGSGWLFGYWAATLDHLIECGRPVVEVSEITSRAAI